MSRRLTNAHLPGQRPGGQQGDMSVSQQHLFGQQLHAQNPAMYATQQTAQQQSIQQQQLLQQQQRQQQQHFQQQQQLQQQQQQQALSLQYQYQQQQQQQIKQQQQQLVQQQQQQLYPHQKAMLAGFAPVAPQHAMPGHHFAPQGAMPMRAVSPQVVNTSGNLPQEYDEKSKIGEGTYGNVYLGILKDGSNRPYALKKFKTGREDDGISPTAIREIMLLRELRHANIVRLDRVHINRQEPSLCLAFDYAEHDLYEMIKVHRDGVRHTDERTKETTMVRGPCGPMDQYIVKSILWQLLNGLSYLHQHWVIHRDLKPSNVLVMGPGTEEGAVKIADFGLARIFQAPLRPLTDNGVVVTIWYRAPELLLGAQHYTPAVDIWAAGCIFAELLMLKPIFQGAEKKGMGDPFQGDQLDKVFRVLGHPSARTWPDLEHLSHWHDNTENVRVKRPEYQAGQLEAVIAEAQRQAVDLAGLNGVARPGFDRGCQTGYRASAEAMRLLSRMLDYNPKTRITAEQALQHEWFREEPKPGPSVYNMPSGQLIFPSPYPRRLHPESLLAPGGGGGNPAAGPAQADARGAMVGGSKGGMLLPKAMQSGLMPSATGAYAASNLGPSASSALLHPSRPPAGNAKKRKADPPLPGMRR